MNPYPSTHTYYCHDLTCEGHKGFPVRWAGDTWTDPGYNLDEECPHCHAEMHPEPLKWEDATEALLDELTAGGVITVEEFDATDRRALFLAVQAELKRQARARYLESLGIPPHATAREYRERIDELVACGELPF